MFLPQRVASVGAGSRGVESVGALEACGKDAGGALQARPTDVNQQAHELPLLLLFKNVALAEDTVTLTRCGDASGGRREWSWSRRTSSSRWGNLSTSAGNASPTDVHHLEEWCEPCGGFTLTCHAWLDVEHAEAATSRWKSEQESVKQMRAIDQPIPENDSGLIRCPLGDSNATHYALAKLALIQTVGGKHTAGVNY